MYPISNRCERDQTKNRIQRDLVGVEARLLRLSKWTFKGKVKEFLSNCDVFLCVKWIECDGILEMGITIPIQVVPQIILIFCPVSNY